MRLTDHTPACTSVASSRRTDANPTHLGGERSSALHERLRRTPSYEQQQRIVTPPPVFLSRAGMAAATQQGDGGAAFDRATSGAAGSLPHQAMMERAFGRSFADVRAHVGGPQAKAGLRAMGARGAAQGNTVAFASSSPSPHLVAHELTHVVQGGGQVRASSVVAPAGCQAEVEAETVADRVAAGGLAGPIGTTACGIHLERVTDGEVEADETAPVATNLDGSAIKTLEGQDAVVGGQSIDPLEERTARAGEDTANSEVIVETQKRSESGDERSVETDRQVVDAKGTAKNLLKEMQSEVSGLDAHDIPALEKDQRTLEELIGKELTPAERVRLERELKATVANLADSRKRRNLLERETRRLKARVDAKEPLSLDEVKAAAARVGGGDGTAVARRSAGKSIRREVDTSKFSLGGHSSSKGSLTQELDADGEVVGGSGEITTQTVGVEHGKVAYGHSVERGDGSSESKNIAIGPQGGSAGMSETDTNGTTRGGTFSVDTKNKSAAAELSSQDKNGEYAKAGFTAKQGQGGAEDEYSTTLGAGKAGTKPGDSSYGGDLTLGNQEIGANTHYKLPRKPDATKGFDFSVGGGGNIKVTVKTLSAAPLKYSLTVAISGTFTLGATPGVKSAGASGSVGATYTRALSKTYTRHYDASKASGALAEFERLQSAKPNVVEKWAMGLGLLGKGGGALSDVGDENTSEDSTTVGVSAQGSVDAGLFGGSAKAAYEGQFKTKVTETVVKPGVVRVTVLYGKAQKASGGVGAKAVTSAEFEYSVNWAKAESLSVDLEQDHADYGQRLDALRNAEDVTQLRALAERFGGSSGWSVSESRTDKRGAQGGFTVMEGEAKGQSVMVDASDSNRVTLEVTCTKEGCSSQGSGSTLNRVGVKAGGGDLVAVENTHGGAATSKGSTAELTLESEHKSTEILGPFDSNDTPLGEILVSSTDVASLVRNALTKSRSTLSGTRYNQGHIRTLLAAARNNQRWQDAAALAGLGGESLGAWNRLRRGLCHPGSRYSEYYAQIRDAKNLGEADKARLKMELDLANQMAAFNEFLGACGPDGQRAIRTALERRGQSLSRGGARRQAGEHYYWPSELSALKGRWIKAQAASLELTRSLGTMLGSEDKTASERRFQSVAEDLHGVIGDFGRARGEHYGEHPEAYADMLAGMKKVKVDVAQLRRRFRREHQARWDARNFSSVDDGPVLESRDFAGEERVRREDAEELELRRSFGEEMQVKLQRQSDRCVGYKRQERALLKKARSKSGLSQGTVISSQLAPLYDAWLGTIFEYRRLLEAADWPRTHWKISAAGGRRNAALEPDYQAIVKLWVEAYGHNDNDLLRRLKSY